MSQYLGIKDIESNDNSLRTGSTSCIMTLDEPDEPFCVLQ